MVKSAPVSNRSINNILYQRLWSCNGLFTQLAYQQEGGALYASVQKCRFLNLRQEPTVTDVYQSSLHDRRFMSPARLNGACP